MTRINAYIRRRAYKTVGCENRNVKQRMQHAFPQNLSFMPSPGKDKLMFFETSKQHLKSRRIDETVKEVGQPIQKQIPEPTSTFSSWPTDPTEIKHETAKIPELLRVLLTKIKERQKV